MLCAFHNGMSARFTVGGHESDLFDVLVCVKQGCVLAPVIFNLFLVAVTLVFHMLEMLKFPSNSGWMAIYSISDGYRQRPKSQETPFRLAVCR